MPFKTIGLADELMERPVCRHCKTIMRLVWIAAHSQGDDRHTFECPGCKTEIEIALNNADAHSFYNRRH